MRNQRSNTNFSFPVLLLASASFAISVFTFSGNAHAQQVVPPQPEVEKTVPGPEVAAVPTAPAPAEATPAESVPPLLPADAAAPAPKQAGSDLPVPNFMKDDPSMSLNPNEALMQGGLGQDAVTEKTPEQLEADKRKEAFDSALKGLLPLTPDEIRQLLEHFDRTQESVEIPVYPSPKPQVAVETVSLDPGVKPLTVKVAYGNVTTLNVLDVTGAPWPIQDISWAGNFEIINSTSSGTKHYDHIIRISPQSEFASGNMSIRLLGLKTPVILSLETSRDIVHYRFDAIVPDYGPLAEAPLIDQGITIEAGDQNLASVLQGVVPAKAQKLAVAGVDGRTTAYKYAGQTFVRTPLTLLSPSWSSSVASADGMHVYMIKSSPVLILSDKGKMVRAHLSDRENILEEIKHD